MEIDYETLLQNALSYICEVVSNAEEYIRICEEVIGLPESMLAEERENFDL